MLCSLIMLSVVLLSVLPVMPEGGQGGVVAVV